VNIETIREYVLLKPSVTEGFPFDEESLVFKVNNKIFMIASLDETPLRFNVKCDPEKVIELRDEYPDTVLPGYHMNKRHWNTIVVDGRLSAKQLKEMIDHSYGLVNKGEKK
jgi:predicted DNA-binding protein (MmcQ/YjbR family)